MARKEWDALSPSYRARLEREIARAEREGREFNRQVARGHVPASGKTEHQQRREREVAKHGPSAARLRPWEIRQLRSQGATASDIQRIERLPNRHKLLQEQRERIGHVRLGIPSNRWVTTIPDVVYYYHGVA